MGDNIDVPFFSDRIRLDNIFTNLLSNSLKYYNPDSPNPYVKLTANLVDNGVEIVIEDNGIGIEQQYHARVFEMFFRASEQSKGSGIGLYIVKEIIDKLKGEISFESTFGEGTTFKVFIPSMKVN